MALDLSQILASDTSSLQLKLALPSDQKEQLSHSPLVGYGRQGNWAFYCILARYWLTSQQLH